MQAAIHADVQLTATASHDELFMPRITQLTLEPTMFDFRELLSTVMLTLVGIAKLLLRLDDTASALLRTDIGGCSSIHDLLGASDQVVFYPERATAPTWRCPFCSTEIAKLCTALATTPS